MGITNGYQAEFKVEVVSNVPTEYIKMDKSAQGIWLP